MAVLASVRFTETHKPPPTDTHTLSQLLQFPDEAKENLTQFLLKTEVL